MTTKLEQAARHVFDAWNHGSPLDTEMAALEEALAEQAEQEPVVKYYGEKLVKGSKVFALLDRDLAPDTLLYTAPVRTKDLTYEEVVEVIKDLPFNNSRVMDAMAVIAAYKEKNK